MEPEEQSDLFLLCLTKRLLNVFSRQQKQTTFAVSFPLDSFRRGIRKVYSKVFISVTD